MKKTFCPLFIFTTWLSINIGISQPTLASDLEEKIPTMMSSAKIPGLSLAVIENGSVVISQSYGIRNAEDSMAIDDNTIFEAASLTKPIFAYAVYLLAEKGKIDLDRPLDEYWPYPDALPDSLRQLITARHIMTHSSGLPNWRRPRNSETVPILFHPGDRFSYSGEGFVYLSKVVAHITDMSTEEWVDKMVFVPLEMKHSTMVWDVDLGSNSAYPHNREGKVSEKYKPEHPNAAASLHTTASDYGRFLIELIDGDRLSSEGRQMILSPQSNVDPTCSQCRQPNSNPAFKDVAWGLGVGLEKTDQTYIWHWGDNGNFKAYFCVSLDMRKGLVYLANGHGGLAIRDQLVSLVLPGDHPAHRWVKYEQVNSEE